MVKARTKRQKLLEIAGNSLQGCYAHPLRAGSARDVCVGGVQVRPGTISPPCTLPFSAERAQHILARWLFRRNARRPPPPYRPRSHRQPCAHAPVARGSCVRRGG